MTVMCATAALVVAWNLGAVAPLTEQQRIALAAASHGRDFQEEAFEALLENVAQWTPGPGEAAIRLGVDAEALGARPEAYRGELFQIQGRLEQHMQLAKPHDKVVEWFVRLDDDPPSHRAEGVASHRASERPAVIVYVDRDTIGPRPLRDGERVVVAARFYKPMKLTARDGALRSYLAFVGAFPRPEGIGEKGASRATGTGSSRVVGGALAALMILLIIFGLLLAHVRRSRGSSSPRRIGGRHEMPKGEPSETGGPPLPADPAEALAELRRRANEP